MEIKRLSYKHKNNKLFYYAINYIRQCIPNAFYHKKLNKKLNNIEANDLKKIMERVNYYNKLTTPEVISNASRLSDLKIKKGSKTYFFDIYEYFRFFNKNSRAHFLYGDVTHVPDEPSFVKSRPISDENKNSVLLKLNKIRHFIFISKDKDYSTKKDIMVWRGKVHITQPHRIKFLSMYCHHPMCNIARVNKNELSTKWLGNRLTISEQLKYKFILSIEGNDVASNLKWIMSSNSIAIMPKPKYETWFMEGKLIPDYHYIAIKDDFSDLENRLKYYINNPAEAQTIIRNANNFVEQFKDKHSEDLISLLVIKKYLTKTQNTENKYS